MPSGEVSTLDIVRDALGKGKQVFVPYIYKLEATPSAPRSSLMDMLALQSMEEFEALKPDNWGIPSLDESSIARRKNCLGGHGLSINQDSAVEAEGNGLDMVVMPGMAFDEGLRRLGHGKGYYDNFLQRLWSKEQENTSRAPRKPYLGKNKQSLDMPVIYTLCPLLKNITLAVALALEEQLLPLTETVPVGDHDWPVDAVVVGDGRVLTSKS